MTVQSILDKVCEEIRDLPGVAGVVLGGSRARGTHHELSDIDIGIYYDESAGFDVGRVSQAAAKLDDEHRNHLIASPGEWGEWVNGGGWLVIHGFHVDFLFRDIHRVARVIEECLSGKVSAHYQTGHPHAYLNVMYMGEIAVCKIWDDPAGRLAKLKARTAPYPKPLQDAIVGYFMFEASFSCMFAEKNADKDDISYVAGHCFRAVSCLNQVLFALNEQYCINEKKAVRMIDGFDRKPENYKSRIDRIMTSLSANAEQTRRAVEQLQELIRETEQRLRSG